MDSLDIASDSWDQHSRVPESRCMNVDLSESQCNATQILGAAVASQSFAGGAIEDSKSATTRAAAQSSWGKRAST